MVLKTNCYWNYIIPSILKKSEMVLKYRQQKADLIATIEEHLAASGECIQELVGTNPTSNGSISAEYALVLSRVQLLETLVANRKEVIQQLREKVLNMQTLKQTRAQDIFNIQKRLDAIRQSSIQTIQTNIQRTTDSYIQIINSMLRHRRRLVKDLLSVFRLRRVLRRKSAGIGNDSGSGKNETERWNTNAMSAMGSTSTLSSPNTSTNRNRGKESRNSNLAAHMSAIDEAAGSQIEYRVLLVGFTIYGALHLLTNQQREKLNAVVGYALQLTIFLSQYLDIVLPFHTTFAGDQSSIQQSFESEIDHGTKPLFTDEANTESFVTGLALLNYNIAYLCYTQGVNIPFERSVNLLENLAACCQAIDLGREFGRPRDTAFTKSQLFDLEASSVIQLHAACWTTGKPWELVSPPTHAEALMGVKVDESARSVSLKSQHSKASLEDVPVQLVAFGAEPTENEDSGDAWHIVDEDEGVSMQI
ncbi:hypothetical protein BDEG_24002 [Batrachochytrium dendrobatidis JEL423]|nr:hypothetical protein BDEG_24002 [Batrachochytrium dendrobatidis JEL423]